MKDSLIASVKEKCSRLKEYENKGYTSFELLVLRGHDINKFVKKFIDMDKDDITDEILDLVDSIIISAKTVYECGDRYCLPFDDEVYDRLISRFKKYRPESFGKNPVGLANAKYKYDVLSGTLGKVHFIYESQRSARETRECLENYINSIPVKDNAVVSVLVNEKKDGTSVTIDYKLVDDYYVPQSAISRGKKDYGEGTDVSAVMPNCEFLSGIIKNTLGFAPKYIGVQYEMLVSKEQKAKFEEYMGQHYVNCRSAVAGLLRRIVFSSADEANKLKKFVSLVPVGFDILPEYVEDDIYYSYPWNKIYDAVLKTFIYGEISMYYSVFEGTKSQLLERFSKIADEALLRRPELNHEIDGLVLTLTNPILQRKMGRKNNINQFQIAYKFPEQSCKTTVRGVEITTGNFGYKEMLLILDPVVLNGTTQYKAQVHSLDKFRKLKPRVGMEIKLLLSGDVIPFGYRDETCEDGNGPYLEFPTHCECGAPLVEEKNRMRCSDPKCPYRVAGSLVTFFKELNAKGIGPKICAQLHEELGIDNPSQVLELSYNDFRKLSGFKDGAAKAAMETIDGILTKPRSVASIISGLAIDCLRTTTAQKLLDVCPVDKLLNLALSGDRHKLIHIIRKADGIDKNAELIADGLIENAKELDKLVTLIPVKESADKSNLNKVILISGMRNDSELEEIANRAGFDVKDSGTKYDILVIRDESMMSASKAQYALSHQKQIMTRSEFIKTYR